MLDRHRESGGNGRVKQKQRALSLAINCTNMRANRARKSAMIFVDWPHASQRPDEDGFRPVDEIEPLAVGLSE